MEKLKVIILTNIPSPYRVAFFNYMQDEASDLDIHIIYTSKNEDNRCWYIDKNQLRQSYFLDSVTIKIPKKNDTKYIHFPIGLQRRLNSLKPDVVVISEYNPTSVKAARWCMFHQKPYISWTDGTLNSEKNINCIQRLLRRYLIQHAKRYIASSSKSKEAQVTYGAEPDKIHISFLTVDIDKYLYPKKSYTARSLLFVGSLIKRKGLDLLIMALSVLKNRDFELDIIGSGPEYSNLLKLAAECGLESKIRFLGFLEGDELLGQYRTHDIFVFPTREDCFGLVLLEAMCSSMAVICSIYADGAGDLIIHGENGYIIDPYDTVHFAEALDILLGNSAKTEMMGRSGFDKAKNFQFKSVAEPYLSAIRNSVRKESSHD